MSVISLVAGNPSIVAWSLEIISRFYDEKYT